MEIFDELSAANLPSGVYFYSLEFKGKSITKKMLILK
ncbi:MAG: T9SS type A sorting domain-containing protein [Chlorobi bacterium]|nr:T9SS type A sorting domain-containing protein [Chlorobiota bacterium]